MPDSVKKGLPKIIPILAVLSLAAVWLYGTLNTKGQDAEQYLPEVLGQEASFERNEELSSNGGSIFIMYDSGGELLGYVTFTEGTGYGGPMLVMVYWSPNGEIINITVPEHHEDEPWWRKLELEGYFSQYAGVAYDSPLVLGEDIDAISGATVSSNGVILGIKQSRYLVSKQLDDPYPWTADEIDFGIPEIMLLIGIIMVFSFRTFPHFKGKRWPRYLSLLYSVVVIGIWLSIPLSVTNIAAWLIGHAPHFHTTMVMYILFFAFVGTALIFGKNYYCYWLCPFSAVQEGVGYIGGAPTKASAKFRKILRYSRYFLLWLSALLVFLAQTPSISIFEPWNTLFSAEGTFVQWALVIVAVGASFLIYNFWCIYLCPVGAFMDVILKLHKGTLGLWRRLVKVKK